MTSPLSEDYVPDKKDGKFPVSIGTSLAIETLFGLNENVPPTDPLPYTQYSSLYVNIRTLVRNLVGAVRKELKEEWTQQRIYQELYDELLNLPDVIERQSHGKLDLYIYFLDYRSIARKYPNALLKPQKSLSSIKSESLEQYVFARLKQEEGDRAVSVFHGDLSFPIDRGKRSLVMTHLPTDLLDYCNTNVLDLLESHTGAIKDSRHWYTKLSNGKELDRIAFNPLTIQIFGDGKTFVGLPSTQRKAVIEFAKENRWNQMTGERLMRKQLERLPDTELRALIKKL